MRILNPVDEYGRYDVRSKSALHCPVIRSHHYKGIPGVKPGIAYVRVAGPANRTDTPDNLEGFIFWYARVACV